MTHGRRWRAVMGVVVALAAVAPAGAAFADDSRPSVSTGLGALARGLDLDAGPALNRVETSVLSLLDQDARTVRTMAVGTLGGAPAAVVRDAGALAACALAVSSRCIGVAGARLSGDVGPVGTGSHDLGGSANCAAGGGCAGPGPRAPASADLPPAAGGAPTIPMAGGVVLDAPAHMAGTAPGLQVASPPVAGRSGGSLASTGSPVAPALAGMLLMVLGCLLRRLNPLLRRGRRELTP
jgi:hypothetical protein